MTKLTDGQRIMDALKAHGYTAEMRGAAIFGKKNGLQIVYDRVGDSYSVSGYLRDMKSIARKYAEVGIKAWANRRGYAVTENDGQRITLVNRRG